MKDAALLRMDAAWFTLFGKLTNGQMTPQELSDAVVAVEVERLRLGLAPIEALITKPWAASSDVLQ